MKIDFPHTVSYNWSVELRREVRISLTALLKIRVLERCSSIYFINLPPSAASTSKEESNIKHSRNLPGEMKKHSRVWFYGFKLRWSSMTRENSYTLFSLRATWTTGRPWNSWTSTNESLGKLFADRGYILKDLFEQLFIDGAHLVTRLKKGMKNALTFQHDKIMLRKRSLLETVNDQLKNICQIEIDSPSLFPELHHQSFIGFGCFLLLRQKAFHQHCWGVCTC